MTSSLTLVIMCGVLVAVGIYLLMERSLTRVVLGISCLGNGVNIMFLIAGGRAGNPPFVEQSQPDSWSDPLVMAMMLTSIVITLATTGFLAAMAYRTWQLRDNDEVRDDVEDRAIALRSEISGHVDERSEAGTDLEQTSEEFRDETEGSESFFKPAGRVVRRWVRRQGVISNPDATRGTEGRR
ncbi:hypothetical protein ACU19_07220 [Actinobaculum suis]|uniref:Na(+)/H(+) antiporter subunit C n=1 Tax=Actinobaculum suis TaxID=1657 RepID=UPI00066FFBA3|nr:Na(+)/H(+) antiporter subunit C [Actinobaculum suis]KMY22934.1 hypothetical protein ACU19_07220 [Actinobaculum suis]